MNLNNSIYQLEDLTYRFQKNREKTLLTTKDYLAIRTLIDEIRKIYKPKLYTISEIAEMYGYKAITFNKVLKSLGVFYIGTYKGKQRYVLSKMLIKEYGKENLIYQERKTLKTNNGFVDIITKPKFTEKFVEVLDDILSKNYIYKLEQKETNEQLELF